MLQSRTSIVSVDSTLDVDLAVFEALTHEVLFEIPESILKVLDSLIHRMEFPRSWIQLQDILGLER